MSSDEDFLSPVQTVPAHKCLLDVLSIHLDSLDLSGIAHTLAF
jgi:hypothetical protein